MRKPFSNLPFFRFKEAGRLDGRRGPHPSGGNNLAEVGIGRFARSEDTRDTGLHPFVDLM